MTKEAHPLHTNRWRQVRKRVLASKPFVCRMPGCLYPHEPLQYDVKINHPLKCELDHIVPVEEAMKRPANERDYLLFDPSNLRPVHHACNQARNHDKLTPVTARPSRDWGI